MWRCGRRPVVLGGSIRAGVLRQAAVCCFKARAGLLRHAAFCLGDGFFKARAGSLRQAALLVVVWSPWLFRPGMALRFAKKLAAGSRLGQVCFGVRTALPGDVKSPLLRRSGLVRFAKELAADSRLGQVCFRVRRSLLSSCSYRCLDQGSALPRRWLAAGSTRDGQACFGLRYFRASSRCLRCFDQGCASPRRWLLAAGCWLLVQGTMGRRAPVCGASRRRPIALGVSTRARVLRQGAGC
jgi:hypothetical protein